MQLEVIIPIGPGHDTLARNAFESVRIATLDRGGFESVRLRAVDDTQGLAGRSAARNSGVRDSRADWLFFLDADDLMHPEALLRVWPFLERYDAVWGAIVEVGDDLRCTWRYQVPRIETLRDLVSFDPAMTLQMGHFVRREVALATPFNENMDCGEDWDYYLRLWRQYRCLKQSHPLLCNRRGSRSQGARAADGVQWGETVRPMVAAELRRLQGTEEG